MSDEIKDLLHKRSMKRNSNRDKIEYVGLYKTIFKKIREQTRSKNMEMIENTIVNNSSIKKVEEAKKQIWKTVTGNVIV